MLANKTVVLGVTGSIAAYKAASLASLLVKAHADVHVIMTKNALNFINPITFETLTGNKCLTDTFDRNFQFNVEHVSLAKKADLFMVAPATANIIAKISGGIADDMLTTTFLAASCPKIIAPAMNTAMLQNQITQDNIQKCIHYGIQIIESSNGRLACGDTGKGKLPEPGFLYEAILNQIALTKDLTGKKLLVTAGPTQESLDPVRYITNHSSGKMGYAIAKAAAMRGADVTLISGPVNIPVPYGVKIQNVISAEDMFNSVKEFSPEADIIIKSAAVADYTPAQFSDNKIKKSDDDLSIKVKRTSDILQWLGQNKKSGQFLCGFSMETQNMIENSRAKLDKKNLDLVCANNLKTEGAGFQKDTNVITLITKEDTQELPLLSKFDAANKILDKIIQMTGRS
ncbi:bifunctional phosphopantothenoylcysteine decarboxylase/phosphopantothenate--cysteine ligase CoaBC [Treponema sp.]|uniref:bifunctional phosphopantothenoylcysteine decarboxylase/phosphopantothenate--cysteine ligase CoaBC n=1 Tax=Treponema sp. TaxID=166 RepID=UPI0025CD4C41|nr:bifunctional phosphopantothenoylcysteine decarboxylase/phosphopantothenate--cysteine ligase CoaBC [Treponema sp.]MCR5218534.1 bifunctional phosphopantothenoylcysteine decarboxylase/phosphopantothenate--cysteine ligase CoaBC [Treponema sp.]